MPNYKVVLEAAWIVKEAKSVDDAMSVAISEAGKRLNAAKMDYVEVEVGGTFCPFCGEPFDSVFVVAGTGIIGLLLEMKVFNAETKEHAERIARKGIGKALKDVPLKVVDITEAE
ncbi:DUF555 domain-containing protein [Methanocella sp. MCL-LM]|uniref:DUF555 domain-containing protein n=1 Tax=Methanocella sp. MCL-LM TaxID=3412035 RepID=UPI003C745ED7